MDVAVVGAGPAGARAAGLLATAGLQVTLLEEHREVGRPVQCAGLLSTRVFERLGREVAVRNRVSGARLHSPSDHVVAFDAGRTRAMVVDRAAFDRDLAEDAVRRGAQLRVGCRVKEVTTSADGCTLRVRDRSAGAGTPLEELHCRAVVGADGPGSIVRSAAHLKGPRQHLTAFQLRVASRQPLEASSVDLFAGRDLAPGFFAWLVPLGDHEGLVGLASEPGGTAPRERLEAFLGSPALKAILPDPQPISMHAGTIPLGPIPRPVADGVVLVGDAAAQPKATSGGGVYPALVAAGHASRALVASLEAGDLSSRALMSYPRTFDAEVGSELRRAARLRRSYRAMSDRLVDQLVQALDDPELLDIVVREGDIEFPSRLVRPLLQRSPSLLRLAGPLLKGFF